MLEKLKPYSKFIVALIGALATSLTIALPDNPTVQLVCGIVISTLTAVGVYAVPNQPKGSDEK
jgi:hypothetical protein